MDAAATSQTPSDVEGGDRRGSSPASPVQPLAPLEYLQNQRRGSITDPSLHASPPDPHHHPHHPHHHLPHHHPARPFATERTKRTPRTTRPTSPFVFGDASVHPPDLSSPNIRRLLRSPSNEAFDPARVPDRPADPDDPPERPRQTSGEFDFNMRRHSIAEHPRRGTPRGSAPAAAAAVPSLPHGLKRKMSQERVLYPMGEEDMDGPTAAPAPPVAPVAAPDMEGPAPKRRGSAFDTHRIAQLSLYDRRESVDNARGQQQQQQQQWWMQDRRDSTSSMFSNASAGGYSSSAFSGDNRPGLASIAWPNHEGDTPISGLPRHLHPRASGPPDPSVVPFSPTAMPPDRRMSVPDVSQHTLRSKSRPGPPSRERHPSTNPSEGDAVAEESETSPTQGHLLHPPGSLKEGASPYSRSPELRVSHKLAERKRRKEMKDLFDELRDQLPADRGMKASKWEILTKGASPSLRWTLLTSCVLAVDYIHSLKTTQHEMSRELELLRHELDSIRSNVPAAPTAGYPSGGVTSPFTHPADTT